MSSDYYTFDITALNSSGAAILVKYGEVHQWWLSHPQVINTQGFIQVTGNGHASGTFILTVSGEEIQVDFCYKPGQKPSLTSRKLSSGPYIVQVTNGPFVEGMTANCTFQVVDPRK